jgi:chromate reductase
MADTIRIAGICGSLRKGSYNAMALEAAKAAAPEGVELDIIRLNDVELYNGEYNYSIPGVLKNAIDWMSRPTGKGPIAGKPAAMIGASTSITGTARAQSHLRSVCFYNAMPLLASAEVLIFRAEDKFDDSGRLTDSTSSEKIADLMEKFVDWIRLQNPS